MVNTNDLLDMLISLLDKTPQTDELKMHFWWHQCSVRMDKAITQASDIVMSIVLIHDQKYHLLS